MRVLCVCAGNQQNSPRVIVGSIYTVTDYTYGWELWHPKTGDLFYQLEGMPEDARFWSGLFAELTEETIIIQTEQTTEV